MFDFVEELLKSRGIKDFDELLPDERESYFRMLEIAESGKITLEDVKKHITAAREAVELALATETLTKSQDIYLKARLKCYLFLDNVFNRPERARYMLEQYGKVKKV
jgi:hypothetical protein